MGAKILLILLILFIASELVLAQCSKNFCPAVKNTNRRCQGKLQYQCVCDFTCSEWDKPCNWVLSCEAEVNDINAVRNRKNKLILLRLPHLNHTECLDININTHKHPNCCNLFCNANVKDVCF
ncbi:uncharacterized protein LOC119548575 [Drosophila subpulchrella]|uniref:uncharacterized protein LOC119548575 n=1 Tax=Drosophila subpulchrella TaxID=1486046 RepID=UPI0018A167B3|nr:uncharacterized protein LOC119548575 [Drosophila subpulchrella]